MSVNRYNSTTGELERIAGGLLYADAPVGSIQAYGGTTAPSGWLLCQGQALSRIEYADLFKAIGIAFGAGDGSTTFNIPDYRGKVPFGADANNAIGTDENGALPNIKGGITGMRAGNGGTANGCVQTTGSAENISTWSGTYGGWNIDASRSSDLYKDGQTTVVPANVRANYIIKAKQVAMPADFKDTIDDVLSEFAKPISLVSVNYSTINFDKSRVIGGVVTVCADIAVQSGSYLVKENAIANVPNYGTASIGYILPCLYRNTANGSEEPGHAVIQTDGNLYPYNTKSEYNQIRINASYSSKI